MKNTFILGLLLIFFVTSSCSIFRQSSNGLSNIANPSAVYCEGLGYRYEIITEEDGGQRGICRFPGGIECGGWSFFNGNCGKEFSYCEQNGGKIDTTAENCQYSSECTICVLSSGKRCIEWDYFNGDCP